MTYENAGRRLDGELPIIGNEMRNLILAEYREIGRQYELCDGLVYAILENESYGVLSLLVENCCIKRSSTTLLSCEIIDNEWFLSEDVIHSKATKILLTVATVKHHLLTALNSEYVKASIKALFDFQSNSKNVRVQIQTGAITSHVDIALSTAKQLLTSHIGHIETVPLNKGLAAELKFTNMTNLLIVASERFIVSTQNNVFTLRHQLDSDSYNKYR